MGLRVPGNPLSVEDDANVYAPRGQARAITFS